MLEVIRLTGCLSVLTALSAGFSAGCLAQGLVAKKALTAKADMGKDVLKDGSFESAGTAPLDAWTFWQTGYAMDSSERRTGKQAIKCALTEQELGKLQRGASQIIELNQTRPVPIIAGGWSKAVTVSGTPDSNYSVYLDILFQDNTPLWGQTANFSTGTHDWEYRERLVVPEKPIKSLTLHAIFRNHSGTAYFDDFTLRQLDPGAGATLFDSVSVVAGEPLSPDESAKLSTNDGLNLSVSSKTGNFLLRDVAAASDFIRPTRQTRQTAPPAKFTFTGQADALGLALEATYSTHPNHIRVDALVRDLRGQDRAITAYFVLPLDALGGQWHDDMRRARAIEPGKDYRNVFHVNAGATGQMSLYPFACVTTKSSALSLGIPLDVPRLTRIGYDSASKELYIAFDLALSPDTKNFPSQAPFSFVIFGSDPQHGFRAALRKYYDIFPSFFEKKVAREGLWMAFTNISTVQGYEDFHFAFKEGNSEVAWDDEHGITTFVYTEPMTNWQRMAKDVPRTYEGAVAELEKNIQSGNRSVREISSVTRLAGSRMADGRYNVSIQNAPWCDGAVFALNPSPHLATTAADPLNCGQFKLRQVESAFEAQRQETVADWRAYGAGYAADSTTKRTGQQAIRCQIAKVGEAAGAVQSVHVGQKQAKPLVMRGWSKAEAVTGERGNNYSLYADLVLDDGSSLYGQAVPFAPGTHDWQQAELVIRAEKPVRSAAFYALFRNTHAGKIWFDDLFFGELGSDVNLLKNPAFEPLPVKPFVLDGAYIDSLEGWSTVLNYKRRHFADVTLPLVFDTHTRRPVILTIFSTYEFAHELHKRTRARGKLMMANGVLHRFPWFAHLLDVMGTETNWHRNKTWRPMNDAALCFVRALCYQKPYCFLMNTHYDDLTFELTARYMKRSLFYGCFPGMFSEDAATNPYFGNPKWYNRDRELFKKYVPLTQRIAKAGWEPVTHATTVHPKVYVERWGDPKRGEVFLTVLNDSDADAAFTLTVDAKTLALASAKELTDLVSGKKLAVEPAGNTLRIRGALAREDVWLLAVR